MTDTWNDRFDAMTIKVDAAIKMPGRERKEKFVNALKEQNECVVIYSAYDTKENDLPVDNLDDVAFKGTFTVIGEYDEFWDHTNSGQQYEGGPITDPTWLELAVMANDCLHATKDDHHVYFEGAEKDENTLRLYFGS